MFAGSLLIALGLHANAALANSDSNLQYYRPISYHLGEASPSTPTGFSVFHPGATFDLNSSFPVLTLDYGAEVAGFPYVDVKSITGSSAQLDSKYSEPYDGLGMLYSDGPLHANPKQSLFHQPIADRFYCSLFVSGLMNSFRTEVFNVSTPGRWKSFFLQGGQRWQSISLLTNSSVTIMDVGFVPSVQIQPPERLPGAFSTSDEILNKVWGLGARAVQAACVKPSSQPSTWEITPQGALIRGQYPGTSAKGLGAGNYTMSFSTKIIQGGTGWRVAASANAGYGPYFVLTTSGPHLANTNVSVIPANSLTAGFGFSIINQAILPSAPPIHYEMPFQVKQDEWYRIKTTISASGYEISINNTLVALVDLHMFDPYINTGWGNSRATDGTWGFGPFQDQAAYFRDVEVLAEDGKTHLYSDPLTTSDVLSEYRVAPNGDAVCLDGAKRDRLIWIGDFAHTARILGASLGFDFVRGMIEYEFKWQLVSGLGKGLVPMQEGMGDGFQFRSKYYPSQYQENDYELFFLLIVGDYYAMTADVNLVRKHWTALKTLVATLQDRFLDPNSGLLADPNGALWFTAQGAQNATAPTALFVIALQQLVPIASMLHDDATAQKYSSLSDMISSNINSKLWSDSLGTYKFALDDSINHSLLSAAFPIRAGIANTTQATRAVESLSDLFLNIGYKDSTRIGDSATTQLSPNVQGFVLESLFLAHIKYNVSASVVTPIIKDMLDIYWPHMVTQDEYGTGAPWEYVYADGSPGIGIFTSLCHPWGGAPTYVLPSYILGLRRELNAEGKYETVFDPVWEIINLLGLTEANGRMPLPNGGWIEASWSLESGGRKTCEAAMVGENDQEKQTSLRNNC